jgi:hypothetical protein
MRPLIVAFLLIISLAVSSSSFAQLTSFLQEPNYVLTVMADGQPLRMNQDILASTKTISLQGQLTRLSEQKCPQLESKLLIRKATLNLVRNTRQIGAISWPSEQSVASLLTQAKAGDHFLVQLEEVALQLKQGDTQPMLTKEPRIYKLTVKE